LKTKNFETRNERDSASESSTSTSSTHSPQTQQQQSDVQLNKCFFKYETIDMATKERVGVGSEKHQIAHKHGWFVGQHHGIGARL